MAGKEHKQSFWSRCWDSLLMMEEWKLVLLIFMATLSLWVLCTLMLPCAPGLLAVACVSIIMSCWPKCKDEGTFARKWSWKSWRKNPIGAFAMWNGTKWSKENLKAKTRTAEAASARGHQYRTGSMDEGGNLSAELLRNQPSIARSLVESLNLTQICFDLLDELQNILDSGAPLPRKAIRKVYLVCLKCCQYLTSSCPHHSKSAAEQSLPVLAANLVTLDLVMHRGNPQLQLGLGIELAVGGQLVYMEKINHWIPEGDICEGCCDECHKPLPRSPGDGEDLQASFFDLSDQGTPAAHPRLDRQNTGAPKHTKGGNTSSANLPSMDPMWCQPPWAWAPYPLALDRLHRAGMEPLPAVDYKGLDQRLRVQCFRELWAKLKKSVRSSIFASSGSSAPTGTTDGEQETPSKLWYQPVEQFDAMPMNV
ncbi:uncharacterized protein PRD47_005838 [Ara ararauna]